MKSDFLVALTQLAAERNLPREMVLSAIEAALASAYRKDTIATGQDISVKLDPGSGDVSVYILKTVVEEVSDPQTEIRLEDARKIKPEAQLDESIATESLPHSAGRIAAQTAKQVVIQRLREAERELVYEEFSGKEGELFSVNVQRMEPRQLIVDLGRAKAVLPASEQAQGERYRPGQKMRVLLKSVDRSSKGPELIVSRADKLLLKRLFELEVPEIYNGAVEIVAIAREAGSRSKVAVRARQDGVDPVGSCVGLRGVRIQSIVNELQGEKIDVVEWSKDPARFIANALSPSQVMRVDLYPETQSAVTVVPDRLLSLAIGREGQNARLAARLTGWNVDIRSSVAAQAGAVEKKELAEAVPVSAESELESLGITTRTVNLLKQAGLNKVGQVIEMSKADLLAIKGFGQKSYSELNERLLALTLLPAEPEVAVPVEEAVAEPVAEEVAAEEPVAKVEAVEAPAAEVEVVEAEAPSIEPAPVQEEAVSAVASTEEEPKDIAAEEAPVPVPDLEVLEPEEEKEAPVPVLDRSASIRDLPEDIWSIRRGAPAEPGQIRFAEEIVGLRGGVTVRRGRRGGDDQRGRKRRAKGGRRRPITR